MHLHRYCPFLCFIACFLGCTKTNPDGTKSTIQVTITSIRPTHGPGGTTDTLRGKGFNQLPNLDSVLINGKKLTVISSNDSQIIATIPVLAGTGNVSIHTPGGDYTGPLFKYDTLVLITTLAGSGTPGFTNGTGLAASFNLPKGIAIDKAGNLFVADYLNAAIRKITPNGMVTTFAGGTRGYLDSTGIFAQFGYISGIAFDSQGFLFVADPDNNRIRKISPAGTVTTVAGTGGYFLHDGPALTTATFAQPYGVTVDPFGIIYVADQQNNEIRMIANGMVSSIAGGGYNQWAYKDGPGPLARFTSPSDITVSPWSGNIYVTEYDNYTVRKITPGFVVSTLAGSSTTGYANGPGPNAMFAGPRCIAVANKYDMLYVADAGNGNIRKIDSSGNVSLFAGWGIGDADGPYPVGSFRSPYGIAIDTAGNLYVTDPLNQKIRKVTVQ
jgi:sugar lactone lactonase YvrE